MAVAAGLEDDAARALCNLGTISAEMRDYRHAARRPGPGAGVHAGARAGRLRPAPARASRPRAAGPGGLGRRGAGRARRRCAERVARRRPGGRRVWCRWACCRPAAATRPRRPRCRRRPSAGSPPSSCSGPRRWRPPEPSTPGCAATTTRDRRGGRPAVYELAVRAAHPWFTGELAFWLWLAGALPRGPGGRGRAVPAAAGRRLAGGGRRCGRSSAARTSGPWRWPAATRTRPRLEALALLDGLGARQTAQRVRRQLRRRGTPRVPRGPIRATAANPAGLTAPAGRGARSAGRGADRRRDRRAAVAVGQDRRPPRLGLAAKLGVGSRREAVAAARERGLVEAAAAAKMGRPAARGREAFPIPPPARS